MSLDMKDEMQAIAEEIAITEYDTEFYDLSDELQCEIFERAIRGWSERRMEAADFARDRERERI